MKKFYKFEKFDSDYVADAIIFTKAEQAQSGPN